MTTPTALINAMSRHQGAAQGISAERLAAVLGVSQRQLRRLISSAREQGVAIGGTPSTGYYVPVTAEELDASCAFLKHRALHSLKLLSTMKRVAMPTLLGQLLLAQG